MEFYADKVKLIRKQQRLSAEEVASKMGIHKTTLCRWEYGHRIPSELKIRALARVLKVQVDTISDLEAEQPVSSIQYSDAIQSWISLSETGKSHQSERTKSLISGIILLDKEVSNTKLIMNALISSVSSICYVKDVNLDYIMANALFLENLSLNKNYSVTHKTDRDFFPQKEAKLNEEQDRQVLVSGKSIINQEGYIPGTRRQKGGLISKIPVFDDEGKISGLVGSFVDITDRLKAEKQRKLLESVINTAGDGFWIAKYGDSLDDFKYLFISNTARALYDIRDEDFKFPLSKAEIKFLIDQTDNKFPVTFNRKIVTGDGQERFLNKRIFKQPYENIYFGITRDITEHKKNEEEKEILYKLLAKSDDAIGIFDSGKGEYIYINEAIGKITGYSPDDFYHESSIFIDKCLGYEDQEFYKKNRKDRKWPELITSKITRKDGAARLIETKVTMIQAFGRECAMFLIRDITNRTRDQNKIEYLEMAIESMATAITFRDLETNQFLYRNMATERIWGYPVKKFFKTSNYDFWLNNLPLEEDRKRISGYIKAGKWPEKFEYLYKNPDDDKLHWIETITSIQKYLDRDCLAAISRDITAGKENEEIHRLLDIHLEATATAVIIHNDDRVIYANQGLADIYGYPLEKLIEGYFDFRINNCVHPDDRVRQNSIRHTYADNKKWPITGEYRIVRPDGCVRWLRGSVSPLEYFGEKCYAVIARDITEEKELAELNQIVLDAGLVSEGLVIIETENNNYLYLNKAIEKIYGYPLETFYENGHDFYFNTCLHPDDRDHELEIKKTGHYPHKRRCRIIRSDGETRYIECVFLSETIYKGRKCMVTIDIDVTDSVNDKNEIVMLKKILEKHNISLQE